MIFQWPKIDRDLFGLLTIGWIPGLFTSFTLRVMGSWNVQVNSTVSNECGGSRERGKN